MVFSVHEALQAKILQSRKAKEHVEDEGDLDSDDDGEEIYKVKASKVIF